ncbi:DMT family transporter [Paenibacillus hamazuiensis]|uniref:DMT family transporter n=1 Tax=Paenibacillus hamazuiensis TaxID=2936508 RepID=UPI00200C827E|nr:DMT family transporter [Paenibacillus hamazuiensis]
MITERGSTHVKNGKIYLMLIGSAILWGVSFNLGKIAVSAIGPMNVVGWRFLIAACCLLLIYYLKERPTYRQLKPNLIRYFFIGVIGIFMTNALVFSGLSSTSAVNTALITAANPAVTLICSFLLLRERMSRQQLLGMILSLIGVWFVITAGSITKLSSVSVGDLLVLCGNSCWALYGVLGRKYLKDSTPQKTTALTMCFGAICFIPFMNFPLEPKPDHLVNLADVWMIIGFIALFGSVLAYLWWNKGISQLGVSRTGLFFNFVPITSMMMSIFMGEDVLVSQIAGAFLVITGVIVSLIRNKQL